MDNCNRPNLVTNAIPRVRQILSLYKQWTVTVVQIQSQYLTVYQCYRRVIRYTGLSASPMGFLVYASISSGPANAILDCYIFAGICTVGFISIMLFVAFIDCPDARIYMAILVFRL